MVKQPLSGQHGWPAGNWKVTRVPFSCPQHENALAAVPCRFLDTCGRTGRRGGGLGGPLEGAVVFPAGTGTSDLSPPGLSLAVPEQTVRWCTVSTQEASKCSSFSESMKSIFPKAFITCVKKTSIQECIKAIAVSHCCLQESEGKSMLSLVILEYFFTHR